MTSLGTISSTQHGVTYWIRDAEDVRSLKFPSGFLASATRWTDDDGRVSYRVDIDIRECEIKPGWGNRPKNPVKVELGVGSKKETLTLE